MNAQQKAEIESKLRAKGVEPHTTKLSGEAPTCTWTVGADDGDAMVVLVDRSANETWSAPRMAALEHVLNLNEGETCEHPVFRESWSTKTGRKLDPRCSIHLSIGRILRNKRFENSDTALRKVENETVFEAALKAAKTGPGGDVLITNVSFGQYVKRVHGAEYDGAMVRFTVKAGAEAFVKAVNAAAAKGTFAVGKAPQAFVAP